MGIHWIDGYSATVESYLVINGHRYRLAKTNGVNFTLDEDCIAPPQTIAVMEITVDGSTDARPIILPDGVRAGERTADYRFAAPF